VVDGETVTTQTPEGDVPSGDEGSAPAGDDEGHPVEAEL
jgi:hypothetical protein